MKLKEPVLSVDGPLSVDSLAKLLLIKMEKEYPTSPPEPVEPEEQTKDDWVKKENRVKAEEQWKC